MKIGEAVFLSLFMGDNENCNISHARGTGLSGIQFSILNVVVVVVVVQIHEYS